MVGDDAPRQLPSVPLAPLLDRDAREVGAFRLLGRLGAGGMGVAYLADGLGQWAVVKVVRSELAEDAGFRARLSRELDAIGRLDGQSARVLESSLDSSMPWFAMEFIPGHTLDHVVRDRGPLEGQALAEIAVGLARLLDGVHRAGIVHRDVKPSNIMMSPDGPRLIDFGIAEVDAGTQLTRTGSVLGSLGWLAPEQVRGDATSAATDVHAWGLCVVFAATGEAPFGSDTGASALYRVLEATPDVPTSVPDPLRGLVARALAKDPLMRPTVAQLIAGPSAPAQLGTTPTASPAILPVNGGASTPRVAQAPPVRTSREPSPSTWAQGNRARPSPTTAWVARNRRVAWTIAAGVGVLIVAAMLVARGNASAPSVAASAPSVAASAPVEVCDGMSLSCAIGDTGPGGGVVFYDAGSNQDWGRYLEAAPAGWSGSWLDPEVTWCAMDQPGYDTMLATDEYIGDGANNTRVIVMACGGDSAAGVARAYAGGGLNDWFLPSKAELNALYSQREAVEAWVASFWSSSQGSAYASGAWNQKFLDGSQNDYLKHLVLRVRPVRAF